jgi:hypothetical protein
MALYGNDIDHTTTPIEADLGWIVKLDKGDFAGRDVLAREKTEGPKRKLVGFKMVDCGIARHGYPVVEGGEEIGVVTSGIHSPTLKKAIGLAYLPLDKSAQAASSWCSSAEKRPGPRHPDPVLQAREIAPWRHKQWPALKTTGTRRATEYVHLEGDVATIGITEYAQKELGDVVFVELPRSVNSSTPPTSWARSSR